MAENANPIAREDGQPGSRQAGFGAALVAALFVAVCALLGGQVWLALHTPLLALVLIPLCAAAVAALFFRWQAARTRALTAHWQKQIGSERDQWQHLLAQHVPVLPVLAGQLRGTAEQVEQAVQQVCASFDEISQRAKRNVGETAILLAAYAERERERNLRLHRLMEQSRATVESALNRIVESSGRAMKAIYQLDDIEKKLQSFASVIESVERVAQRARNIAERAAKHKSNDRQWTQDLAQLAEFTARAAAMSGEPLGDITSKLRLIHDEMKIVASSDFSAILEDRGAMEKTIDTLAEENEQLRYAARQAAEQEQALAQDVSHAVRALQFQDAVRQRLDHVVQSLVMTEQSFYMRIAGLDAASSKKMQLDQQWSARLEKIYTMAEEREVLASHMGSAPPPEPVSDSRIELF